MKAKPAVTIELDKERHLLLDLNAMITFQETTGKNLFSADTGKTLSKNMSPADLRALLWACLIHEDEKLTLEQVGSWIHTGNITDIATRLSETWNQAMPNTENTNTVINKTAGESAGETTDPLSQNRTG